jgi:catechol 2,3-dioxygenase-like lactoylglutathione lyase family enzyme
MISHVKFVTIPTADQDRALKFWTEVVGFRVFTDQPFNDKQRWIELRIGSSDTRLVLFMFDDGQKPGTTFNGALACSNVEQTYQELSARGVCTTGFGPRASRRHGIGNTRAVAMVAPRPAAPGGRDRCPRVKRARSRSGPGSVAQTRGIRSASPCIGQGDARSMLPPVRSVPR